VTDYKGAHQIVANALKQGWLVRPDACEKCGRKLCRIEAHHESYDAPLAVEWPCRTCHNARHGIEPGQAGVPMCVRLAPDKKELLKKISQERGHKDLSETLNEAMAVFVDDYIAGKVLR
jgi:hypothetical protein